MPELCAEPGTLYFEGVIERPVATRPFRGDTPHSPAKARPGISFIAPCALEHSTAGRNAMADALVDLFDAGSTNAEARIKFFTTGGITLLATVLMANPSFGNAASGVAEGLTLPWSDAAAAADGVASEFIIVDRDENPVLNGTVGLSGEDLDLPSGVEINVGDIVKILSISYTAAP